MDIKNHCGKKFCACDHRFCVKGWLENRNDPLGKWYRTINNREYEYVKPCGACRPELFDELVNQSN